MYQKLHFKKAPSHYHAPLEIKIAGARTAKHSEITDSFLKHLLFISGVSTEITFIGMPIHVLENALLILKEMKQLSCGLKFEVDENEGSRTVTKVLRMLKVFSDEAKRFQSLPRVQLTPLVRLTGKRTACLREFYSLKGTWERNGIPCFPLVHYNGPSDLRTIEAATVNLLRRDIPLLVYGERLDENLLKIMVRYNNVYTLHDGLNRCMYKSIEKTLKLGCSCGIRRLFIRSDGTVWPCYGAFLQGVSMGNITQRPLLKILGSYRQPPPLKICRGCQRLAYCDRCRFIPRAAKKLFCYDR